MLVSVQRGTPTWSLPYTYQKRYREDICSGPNNAFPPASVRKANYGQ